ncbi:MAG: hypothetical protein RIF41_28285 [Polyangiaceae bacterium]
MLPPRRLFPLAIGFIAVVTTSASVTHAEPDRARCIEAYEAGQQRRQDGKLAAAREELLVCVQQTCPDFVQPDCERWLGEVNALLPSIVIAAKGPSGADTTAVRVFVDDQLVAEQLDGRPIVIDPGPHELRFEHGAEAPKRSSIVVQQGVKNRVVEVTWEAAPPVATAEPTTVEPPPPPPERGQPVVAYVLGGLGLAAFGSFAAFGILGKNEADDLNARCGDGAPPGGRCTESEIDSARIKLIAADVSLGVGAGLLAVGLGLFIHHHASAPDSETTALRLDLGPTRGGAAGQLTLSF